jgi:hypothetical protein
MRFSSPRAVRAGERREQIIERTVFLNQDDDMRKVLSLRRRRRRRERGYDGSRTGTAATAAAQRSGKRCSQKESAKRQKPQRTMLTRHSI